MSDTVPGRSYTIPVTAQLVDQRFEHRVTEEAAAASSHSRYQALCGQLFIAALLAAPPGPPCPACAAVLASPAPPTDPRQARHRRHGLLRRLLRPQRQASAISVPDHGGNR